MATTEEMSLCRKVLGLGMTITAQKTMHMHVDYSSHCDQISCWNDHSDGSDGWGCNDHVVYLGEFYRQPWDRKDNRESAKRLELLIAELEALVIRDEDGVPV